ncbi:MAG: restriction endonuclease subunit S [Desulfovibrio sp.]|jgi:type I restriction enzyme S subunit|nr:restriction endonuclease subunit S [Desulfovibrio sp.]
MSKWPTVKIGDILVERHETPSDGDLSLGRVRIISKISFDTGQIDLRSESKTNTGMILARPGDLVISGINAAKGAIALYNSDNTEPIAATIHYSAYTPKSDRAEIKFLWWFFRSQYFRELLHQHVPGGIKTELKAKRFLPIPIPLPPLGEQRRIVARIEELAAQIYEARSLRRQAAEEADVLIRANRNQSFKKLCSYCSQRRLDSVADCRLGKMLDPRFKTGIGSTPYLRNANVQWGRLDLRDVYQMDFTARERAEFALESEDILVCEGGDIGKASIWNNEIPGCCYQKALHRIRCDQTKMLPQFMLHHLFWAADEGHWLALKTQTTIPHLTGVKLKAYSIVVPTLPVQRRIVAELDTLQTQVDALKCLQAETAAELDALLPAVLDRAFKGELFDMVRNERARPSADLSYCSVEGWHRHD